MTRIIDMTNGNQTNIKEILFCEQKKKLSFYKSVLPINANCVPLKNISEGLPSNSMAVIKLVVKLRLTGNNFISEPCKKSADEFDDDLLKNP